MNVSKLTDVELNRAMIWLYPTDGRVWNDGFFYYCSSRGVLTYLLNWNLTMPLAVENGLSIELPEDEFECVGTVTRYFHRSTDIAVDFNSKVNPLRAICEVLVMIGMER